MTNTIIPLSLNSSALKLGQETEGWNLASDNADVGASSREFCYRVSFERSFALPPVVMVGLTGFDIDQRESARLSVALGLVDSKGFDVLIRTWDRTRVYEVDISWMAIGS